MTDPPDSSSQPPAAHRREELLSTIRAALTDEAGADARTAGAIACRAILETLEPELAMDARQITSSAPATSASSSPLASLLATLGHMSASNPAMAGFLEAVGRIPREHLLQTVGGLRWLLSQGGPRYLRRPPTGPLRPPERGP